MWSMERSRGPPNTQYVTIWLCFGATWLLFGPAGAGFACLSNPCVHGVCMDDLNSSYSCYCIDGYTGVQCQTNWDECWSSPCRNGGTCIDGVASYNCSCPEGFIGNDCEENFDECLSSPCQNNGTCIDVDNGYRCCCMDGFLGEHCEHDVAVCNATSTERCQHGGQCVEGPGLEFYCRCPPGWQGKLCSDDIDECASSPCQNGGVCIDKMASYSCACFLGYTGTDCQVEVAVCDDSPCSNNAICLTEDDLPVCYCVPDFHGERCEMQYDECQLGPRCTNGGTCIDGVDGFTCSCPHHLTGILCECLILDNNQLDCTYIAPSTVEPNITDRTTLTTEYDVFSTITTTQKETTTYVDFTTELSTTTDGDVTEISTLDTPTTTDFTTEYSTVSTSGGSTTIYDIFTTFITTITPFTSSQTTISPETTTDEFTELTTLLTETTTMFNNMTTGFTDYTIITITTPGVTDITTVGMTDTEFTTLTTLFTKTTESPTSETTIIPITKSPEGRESNDSITFTTRIPENITEFFTESPGITTLTADTTTATPYTMKPTITTTEYTTLSTTDIDMGTQHTTQMPDCNATKCQNGGECIHTSEGNRCVCPFRWEGALCEVKIMIKTAAFSGDSYISHRITNVSDIDVQLKAKTISPNGILIYGGIDDDAYLSVYLENGLLKFKFSCGIQTMLLSELEAPVNTGFEMCIDAKLVFNQNFTHCNATLKVNDTLTMSGDQTSLVTSGNIWTSTNKPRAWLHLGGAPVQSTSPVSDVADGFVGCIHSLQIGGQTKQIFNDAMDGFEVTECSSLACLSHPCKNGAKCKEDGEKWSCTCRTGFVGKSCERSICENNPCLYGATCTPFPATGFICLCPLGKHGQYCEYNFEIVQPSFASSLNGLSSFAAYPIPTAIRHSMEMRFKIIPNTLEQISLLAFMGQEGMHDSSSDHVAVSFVKGYIMLTWNLGSGPRRIFTSSPIVPKVNKPNIIRIGRTDRRAWLFVDNMGNITGRSPGHLTQLDVESALYIGGHEAVNFSTLPHDLPFHTGFSGCIFDVEMRAGRSLVSIEDSRLARGRGVGRCETSECHAYACQKGGACLQHGAAFSCLCQDGSFGPLCTEKSNLCDTKYNKCHSSAVCVLTIAGFECDCPFGRTGLYCEKLGNITDVSFSGRRSFLSLQVPANFPFLSSQYSMSMEIRPLGEEGLVLFTGNAMGFACLSLQGGVLEFRVKGRNSHTMIIRSGRVLALGEWHNLRIGRYGRRVHMWVEGVVNAGTTHPADSVPFYLDDDIYIGGLSDLSTLPYNALQGYPVSFKGCVRKLQINSMRLPLNESYVRESRNVDDCDGTPCGGDFCEHGGTCRLDNASLPMCNCSSRHHGERCEVTVSCSEEPCEHDGRCVRRRENEPSRCACPLGWGGQFCEIAVKGKSPQFSGNSFLLLDKQRSSIKDKRSKTDLRLHPNVSFLRFNFSTMEPDSIILWCSTGPDYLGIGVKGGFIKLASSLLSTEKGILEIPSSNQVSDGDWHEMSLTIHESNLTLKLDQKNIYSKTRDHWNINLLTEGSFYLGGFPEDESTEQHTSGIFTNTFTGCLQELSLGDENSITDFSHYKGENIGSCQL